jgi:hypothetical protein
MTGAERQRAGDDCERATKGVEFAENRHAEMVVRAGAGREGSGRSDAFAGWTLPAPSAVNRFSLTRTAAGPERSEPRSGRPCRFPNR